MRYLALGDSVSIDLYTGVEGGGAASQFARLIGADEVQDLTHDGFTTKAVTESLRAVSLRPDVVTLTVGGNDLLQRALWNADRHSAKKPDTAAIVERLRDVYFRLSYKFHGKVIVNTIYDPTDGDDELLVQLGVPPAFREAYNQTNKAIRELARRYAFLLSDLQQLFVGHGMNSPDTWITMEIEPNHAGATAIAEHWHDLCQQPEKGMVLRDVRDGWSFSLVAHGYQFGDEGALGKWDAEWLIVLFRVTSPESSWSWIDSSLMLGEANMLAHWLRDVANGRAASDNIGFTEPEVSFECADRDDQTVTLRVCLSQPQPNSYTSGQTFRQQWTRSARLRLAGWTAQVFCKDFTVARLDLLQASELLLENLRQLPPGDERSVEG